MLLLDSQVLLWLLDDNPRLGSRARQAITSAQGVYVSAATVWELTIKTMLGKLSVPADLSKRLTAQGFALLSITAEHAEAIRDFPELVRHDPFDRLLVAQATRAGLRLLTADQVLLGLGHDFIIDASRLRLTGARIRLRARIPASRHGDRAGTSATGQGVYGCDRAARTRPWKRAETRGLEPGREADDHSMHYPYQQADHVQTVTPLPFRKIEILFH